MDSTTIIIIGIVLVALGYVYKSRKKESKQEVIRKEPAANLLGDRDLSATLPSVSTIGGGFRWKPDSEGHPGKPVMLTPAPWAQADVKLFGPFGNDITGHVVKRGRTNPDRETYYFIHKSAKSLPKNTIVQIGNRRFKIPNPAQDYR